MMTFVPVKQQIYFTITNQTSLKLYEIKYHLNKLLNQLINVKLHLPQTLYWKGQFIKQTL